MTASPFAQQAPSHVACAYPITPLAITMPVITATATITLIGR